MNKDLNDTWLRGLTGYEIYTRSFMDTNDDGIGDINGIRERLDYLKWLGTDILWLTPIYPSPDHDHGYDVADYLNVREDHGTIADVEGLISDVHERDMRLILDIVPNHTSWDHPWFKAALADPDGPERDMYIFRDPGPDGGPPNNWLSHFGGPAWTLDEASGQYWLHLFVKEQPDLNWRNQRVREEFEAIYRFWFERGIDGFRIDVAHGMLKHPSFSDNPQIHDIPAGAGPQEIFDCYDHKFDMDQDDNIEIFTRWQDIASEYDAILLAESGVNDPKRLVRYVTPGAMDLTFYLRPGHMRWEPETIISHHLELARLEPHRISWVISNHDVARPVSRFSESVTGTPDERVRVGQRRSLCVSTFILALGGVPFLYYGEELGLPNGAVDPNARQDPIQTRNAVAGGEARDVARTPMPWDSSPFNGFSTAAPWITSEDRPAAETVAHQRGTETSVLSQYRQLLTARKAASDLYTEDLQVLVEAPDHVVLKRGSVVVVANFSAGALTVDLPGSGGAPTLIFASDPFGRSAAAAFENGAVTVAPETTIYLQLTR